MFRTVLRNAANSRVGVRMQSTYARGPRSTRFLYGAGATGLVAFSMFNATISNDADAKKVKKERAQVAGETKEGKKAEEKKAEEKEAEEKKEEKKDSEKSLVKKDSEEKDSEKETSSPDSEESSPSDEGAQSAAFNPETGEINWDCPCLGGMADGPCGEEFKEAFSCFIYSETEPKGIDCIKKFENMRSCFKKYPEHYREELYDDETQEELVDVSEGATDVEQKEIEKKATSEAKTQTKSDEKNVPNTKPHPEVEERVEKKAPEETKA